MDVDLSSHDLFVPGVPHEVFDRLRDEAPVYHNPNPEPGGFYALTRYADVMKASRDYKTFSSARGTNIEDTYAQSGTELMMLNMDPPKHTKLRMLVSKGFTPKMINALEPHVRDITRQIIDEIALRGECDFVTDVAAELPLEVIAELIGIPLEDRHKVFDWSNTMIGFEDPEYGNSVEKARQAAMELYAYADSLAQQRRAERREDLISIMVEAEVEAEKLTDMEIDVFFLLLAVAGNETTRNLISGGMQALLEHPDQRDRLAADPSLLPTAVEEMLRWVTPVMYFRRTATCDTELGGEEIPADSKVALWYIAANRDPEAFPNPHSFDVGRTPNEHLTFGAGGPHFCLGINLAQLEIKVMFEELLRRLPDMEQAGPVSRLRSNFINGIKHMPLKFTPERG